MSYVDFYEKYFNSPGTRMAIDYLLSDKLLETINNKSDEYGYDKVSNAMGLTRKNIKFVLVDYDEYIHRAIEKVNNELDNSSNVILIAFELLIREEGFSFGLDYSVISDMNQIKNIDINHNLRVYDLFYCIPDSQDINEEDRNYIPSQKRETDKNSFPSLKKNAFFNDYNSQFANAMP